MHYAFYVRLLFVLFPWVLVLIAALRAVKMVRTGQRSWNAPITKHQATILRKYTTHSEESILLSNQTNTVETCHIKFQTEDRGTITRAVPPSSTQCYKRATKASFRCAVTFSAAL